MAASIKIWSYHGNSSGTTSDVTAGTLRHKRADNDTLDFNTPMRIPSSGTFYGWRKHTKLAIATPPSQTISNLRFFADGDPDGSWTGCSLFAGVTGTYKGPDHADRVSPPHPSPSGSIDEAAQLGGTANVDTYTASSPIVITAGNVAVSTDTFPTVGSQSFIVLQGAVESVATPGAITPRLTRYRYNEL